MAACRLAQRGKTMADASYNTEVESIKKNVSMQSGRSQNGVSKKRMPSVQLPSDFNTNDYVSRRYSGKGR
ncbi:FERM central domain containing protein, partial [Aphelenchoides avenae]